jgi:hypothetical protein
MNNLRKGLIVALLHVLIILSLAGKLLYDRASRPRVWVRTGSIDPDMPIRGRYFTLNVQVRAPEVSSNKSQYVYQAVELAAENGQLVAHPTNKNSGLSISSWINGPNRAGSDVYFLSPSLPFFIPEHAETPQLRGGDQLWAEVTIPRKGPPRPIQLAIKRGSEWIPLTYR